MNLKDSTKFRTLLDQLNTIAAEILYLIENNDQPTNNPYITNLENNLREVEADITDVQEDLGYI